MIHDFLIVGAGLYGATCAYELTRRGYKCLVIDKRPHIGGNCFTENLDGINVHRYGPHIFHTDSRKIWDWINQFTTFNDYRHRAKVMRHGKLYSFPINLTTLRQLWGPMTADEARARLERERVIGLNTDTAEGWLLSQVGQNIYDTFFHGYTFKQWGRPVNDLPASIVRRIPIRFTENEYYFGDKFQGIPIGGYTRIFERLLAGCDVQTRVDYFNARFGFDLKAKQVIYTGPIDRFFNYELGRLEYRSMTFDHQPLQIQNYQGHAVINHPSFSVDYTRIVEHKHFERGEQPVTWITREYPGSTGEPMYPIEDERNREMYRQYRELTKLPQWRNHHFGGRMAEYRYYDMHQVIGSALAAVERLFGPSQGLI